MSDSLASLVARVPVLFVNHEVELGGAERSLLSLLGSLDQTRYEPHLACSWKGPLPDAARDCGVEVHDVPMRFRGKAQKALGLLRASRSLEQVMRNRAIRLVHTNTLLAGYAGLLAARRGGVPCVWHTRDLSCPKSGLWAARHATWRIANSHATGAALGNERIAVVHDGVERAFFEQPARRDEVRDEFGLPASQKLVAIAGRLDRWKGHAVLFEAAARLYDRLRDTTWLVIGSVGPDGARARLANYREELELRVFGLGLKTRVQFLGPRSDAARLLSACDVLVHASTEPEPSDRSIAEAHALGVPVVASDLGGIPEQIDHGVDGWLVPAGDPAALAERIATLLEDPMERLRMGSAGRATAERRWTAAAHARAIEAVYEQVLGIPQSAAAPATELAQLLRV